MPELVDVDTTSASTTEAVTALPWLTISEACDLLRVTPDNAAIIDAHVSGIPAYVETATGYPATCTKSTGCDGMVRQLCRFILCLWFDPDGTDAAQLTRAVDTLTNATKALVMAEGMEG